MNRTTLTFVAVAFAAGGCAGFFFGRRPHLEPSKTTCSGPEAEPETAIPPVAAARAPGDCQNLQNQLAICMAYHPAPSETEKFLAMCRADLDICRDKPNLPACWDFIDLAPIYDRKLGEVDPSPETVERAKNLSAEECAEVFTWADRAELQQERCLKGRSKPPPGFEEKYGQPIKDRPFIKACRRTDAVNAFLRREAERGGKGAKPFHIGPHGDGPGFVLRLPDGRSVPWVPEDALDASAP